MSVVRNDILIDQIENLITRTFFNTTIGDRKVEVAFPAIKSIFSSDQALFNAERAVIVTSYAALSPTLNNVARLSPKGTEVNIIFEAGDYGFMSGQMRSRSEPGYGENSWNVRIYLSDTQFRYVTKDGSRAQYTLQHLLNHELTHAFKNNAPDDSDFLRLVNKINNETQAGPSRNLDYTIPPIPDPKCFVAGTPILMADGMEKPIEEVRLGDNVMSFDPKADRGLGANVPKKVTRLFRNETNELVDLRGLRMTPGHMVLSDNGEWLTISQVLKQDRCIVEDRGGKPVLVRARTGVVAGTADDTPIFVAYVDRKTKRETVVKVRAGIPSLYSKKNDVWYSAARVLKMEGGKVTPSGDIIFGNEISECIDWPENSTPFDHEFQRDFIVSDANGQAYMPEWVAAISDASEEHGRVVNGSSRNMRVISSSYPPSSGGLNRRERRKQTALRRVK